LERFNIIIEPWCIEGFALVSMIPDL